MENLEKQGTGIREQEPVLEMEGWPRPLPADN
jgi:hypothetical protein